MDTYYHSILNRWVMRLDYGLSLTFLSSKKFMKLYIFTDKRPKSKYKNT